MGHDVHFLKRLKRLDLPHVELALTLYNDTELLDWVIQTANIPEPTERVAIALEHGSEPPWLIVSWEGRFVTCLGPGMHPENHPVISRGSLEKAMDQIAGIRERLSLDAGPDGKVRVEKLVSRIYRASDEMNREEFEALAAWQPALRGQFLELLVETGQSVARRTTWLVDNVLKRPRARHRRDLQNYWRDLFALGPLTVLACLDSRDMFEELPADSGLKSDLSWITMVHGITSIGLHALWGVAKVGKPLLGPYKLALSAGPVDARFVDVAMGLAVIGMRHRQLQAEVIKSLRGCSPGDYASTPEWEEILAGFILTLLDVLNRTAPDWYVEATGKKIAIETAELVAPDSPYRYRAYRDVPHELWLPFCVHYRLDYRMRGDALGHMVRTLPTLARADASELFLPRDLLLELHEPWTPAHTLTHLENEATYLGEQKPVVHKKKEPGRNDPCPCGSGRKYKVCCARK